MTPLRSRVVLLVLAVALLCSSTEAFAATRKRPVRLLSGTYVTGQVLDAASNAPVFDAVVTIQGKTGIATKSGSFTVAGLTTGAATVKVERWGYNTLTQQMTIVTGANTIVLKPTSKPVVKVTLSNGTAVNLDAESAEFRSLQPFVGYEPIRDPIVTCNPLTVPASPGVQGGVNEADIKAIDGPATVGPQSGCCNGLNVTTVRFTLRDGRSITESFKDCLYYTVRFGGRDRATGNDAVFSLTDVTRIEFP